MSLDTSRQRGMQRGMQPHPRTPWIRHCCCAVLVCSLKGWHYCRVRSCYITTGDWSATTSATSDTTRARRTSTTPSQLLQLMETTQRYCDVNSTTSTSTLCTAYTYKRTMLRAPDHALPTMSSWPSKTVRHATRSFLTLSWATKGSASLQP